MLVLDYSQRFKTWSQEMEAAGINITGFNIAAERPGLIHEENATFANILRIAFLEGNTSFQIPKIQTNSKKFES